MENLQMSPIQRWKTINSQLVFDHQWCQVRQDEVELPSGQVIDDYFVNIRPDIALVWQLRHAKRLSLFVNTGMVLVRFY
jgi:hypothetical protein